jgi:hypothetical protein
MTRLLSQLTSLPIRLKALVLTNLTLTICFVLFLSMVVKSGEIRYADFTNFYTGWAMVRDGQGARLYDLDLQATYQQRILNGRGFKDGLLPFVNPPHSALPLAPLAWLSRDAAHAVWLALNLALLVYFIRRLGYLAREWSPGERLALGSIVLAIYPLYVTFLLGAFSLIVSISLLNSYLALRDGKDAQAALWLFLGTVKFQLVLLPAIWLVGARRWRAVGWGLLLSLVAFGVTGLLFGWAIWGDYLRVLELHSQSYNVMGIIPSGTYSFKGALALALGDQAAPLINNVSLAAFGLAAAASLLLGLRQRRGDPHGPGLSLGLAMLLGIVFNLHLYLHDVLTAVVPATLLYASLRDSGAPLRRYAGLLLLAPLLAFIGELIIDDALRLRVVVVLLFVLLGWHSRTVWRAARAAA